MLEDCVLICFHSCLIAGHRRQLPIMLDVHARLEVAEGQLQIGFRREALGCRV